MPMKIRFSADCVSDPRVSLPSKTILPTWKSKPQSDWPDNFTRSVIRVIGLKLPAPGHPITLPYSRTGACCACSRCGAGGLFFLFFFSSSFSDASSLGRRLGILKYCDLGRCYPMLVVSYYRRRAR